MKKMIITFESENRKVERTEKFDSINEMFGIIKRTSDEESGMKLVSIYFYEDDII